MATNTTEYAGGSATFDERTGTTSNAGSFAPVAPPAAVTYTPVQAAPAQGYEAAQVGDAATYDAAQVGTAIGYDPTKVDPATYTATTGVIERANPTLRTVQDNELVRNQLTQILDQKESPLLQRAQARSQAYMAASGGRNSTMAAQAGTAALIDAAMPIAQADAAAFTTAARDNQTWLNNVSMFNVNQANNMTQFNVGEVNTSLRYNAEATNIARQFNASAENNAKEFFATEQNTNNRFNVTQTNAQRSQWAQDQNANNRFNVGETNASRQFSASEANATNRFNVGQVNQAGIANVGEINRMATAAFSAQENRIIESNRQAAAVFNQFQANVQAIQQNPNMDEPSRQAAIATAQEVARGGVAMVSSSTGQDFSRYLDFTPDTSAASNVGDARTSTGSQPDMTRPGVIGSNADLWAGGGAG